MEGNCQVPKFTVVIAGKRHHIRFFPGDRQGDRNGNPIPGTLVEAGCAHPFEFDFYLCAHSAIKGTARPVHYHVILNEGEYEAAELQSFIFEHCFAHRCRSRRRRRRFKGRRHFFTSRSFLRRRVGCRTRLANRLANASAAATVTTISLRTLTRSRISCGDRARARTVRPRLPGR